MDRVEKIFFAINHQQVENAIKKSLEDIDGFKFEVVFAAVHKEQVVNEIMTKRPTILILEEGLQGNVDIFTLVEQISKHLPETRIIFLAGDRKAGDPKLARLVAHHIYDIVLGGKVSVPEIVNLIVHPTPYSEVTKFLQTKDDIFNGDDLVSEDEPNKNGDTKLTSTTILIKGDVVEAEETPEKKKPINPFSSIGALASKFPKKHEKGGESEENKAPSVPPNVPLTNPGPGSGPDSYPQQEYEQTINNPSPGYIPQQQVPQWQQFQQAPQQSPGFYFPPQNQTIPQQSQQPHADNRSNWIRRIGKNDRIVNAKQQLITFYSPKGGVGTTCTALNAAVEAALRKQKILLIEFDVVTSALCYWFDFPNEGFGLEDALFGVGSQNYENVSNAIITKEKLLSKSDSPFYDGYKTLPDTLDYMFFSDAYFRKKNKEEVSPTTLQNFLYFCLYQLNYDEVYIDISTSTNRALVEQCLIMSGKNVILMSQDIAIINNVATFFKELNKHGLKFDIGYITEDKKPNDVTEKNIYLINKYSSSGVFTDTKILKWIKCKNVCTIPEAGVEVNSILARGYVPVLQSKSRIYRDSFKNLGNLLES